MNTADYRAVLIESFGQRYDTSRDSWTDEQALRGIVSTLLSALGPAPARVLDLGTGRGPDARALLEAGHQVTGLDLIQTPQWYELAASYPDRAHFVRADVGDLASVTGHGEFDAVLDNGCLHHQQPDSYAAVLGQIRAALRPGGTLVLSLFGTRAEQGVLHNEADGRLSREFTAAEAVDLLAGTGLELVALEVVARVRPDRCYLVLTARAG
ncbi:MAG: class I SAM-dependent methyltransferase [Actinomycetota bacterium]|nr:class I SAM-dependent methyltransferase [Actinomycetota bacterium]